MKSRVYFIKIGKPDTTQSVSRKLRMLIEKSGILDFIEKDDFAGVKIHFGEEGNTGHIHHGWAAEAVKSLYKITPNVFLTDSNVLYKTSRRTNSVDHLKIAAEHGFSIESIGAPVIIADGLFGRNTTEVEISQKHLARVHLASDIASCDSLLALTHVTGHFQTGLGGALKNMGMGCASRKGKYEQHSGIAPEINPESCIGCGNCVIHCPASCIAIVDKKAGIRAADCIGCGECVVVCRTKALNIKWSETLENLQEKMVEYAYGVCRALDGKYAFINFLTRITKDCDCIARDDPGIAPDLGILASRDPVAIDKASVDIINASAGRDIMKESHPRTEWIAQLKYAAGIGLGGLDYELKETC